MQQVTLYTTHCPKCKIIESKLNNKSIPFSVVDDIKVMESKGFQDAPHLEVDGRMMNFVEANNWVNQQ